MGGLNYVDFESGVARFLPILCLGAEFMDEERVLLWRNDSVLLFDLRTPEAPAQLLYRVDGESHSIGHTRNERAHVRRVRAGWEEEGLTIWSQLTRSPDWLARPYVTCSHYLIRAQSDSAGATSTNAWLISEERRSSEPVTRILAVEGDLVLVLSRAPNSSHAFLPSYRLICLKTGELVREWSAPPSVLITLDQAGRILHVTNRKLKVLP